MLNIQRTYTLMKSRPSLLFMLPFFFFTSSGAWSNSEPVLLQSSVSPESGASGMPIVFESQWDDPDGDFVVDVAVRYRRPGGDWLTAVLDFLPGTSPPQFIITLPVDGPAGDYEVQFQASDAATETGPRIHTTDWQGFRNLNLVDYSPECIGSFPDLSNDSSFTPFSISIEGPSTVVEGTSVVLTAQLPDGLGFTPSLEWCSVRGVLEYLPGFDDYSKVQWTPPSVVEDESIIISLVATDLSSFAIHADHPIAISNDGAMNSDNPPPTITLHTPPYLIRGVPWAARFRVQDFDQQGNDTTDLASTAVSVQCDGGPFALIADGLNGEAYRAPWTPQAAGRCRLQVVAHDGNASTTVQGDLFEVRPNYSVSGFVKFDGIGLEGVPILFDYLPILGNPNAGVASEADGFYHREYLFEGDYTITPVSEEFIFEPQFVIATFLPENEIQRFDFVATFMPNFKVVDIDIKPGSDENPINYSSNGKIPVAILSSSDFDAPTEVDQPTLTFGRTGNEESLHYRGNGEPNCSGDEDHNGDGLNDLKCHFHTPIAGFQPGDTEGILRGMTFSGEAFEGRDHITIVGPGIFSNGFDSGGFGDWSSVVGGGN